MIHSAVGLDGARREGGKRARRRVADDAHNGEGQPAFLRVSRRQMGFHIDGERLRLRAQQRLGGNVEHGRVDAGDAAQNRLAAGAGEALDENAGDQGMRRRPRRRRDSFGADDNVAGAQLRVEPAGEPKTHDGREILVRNALERRRQHRDIGAATDRGQPVAGGAGGLAGEAVTTRTGASARFGGFSATSAAHRPLSPPRQRGRYDRRLQSAKSQSLRSSQSPNWTRLLSPRVRLR